MRHRNKLNHLGRGTQHRKALLRNLAIALIEHKHITTTTAKAKALRIFIEPLLTRAKKDSTHNRRIVFSTIGDKHAVESMFTDVAEKIAQRPGGYTRVIKMSPRPGDAAEMAFMELVDYSLLSGSEETKAATAATETKKRTRRGGKKTTAPGTKTESKDKTKKPSTNLPAKPKIRQRKSGGS